jgi:ribonuclease HI
MVQSDTEADMVEIELDDVDNIRVPADALKDALDALPDKPADEVAMVTDSVIVTGDGDNDTWVRVMRPSNFIKMGDDESQKYYNGHIGQLYDMIDDARTRDGAEYVRENIAGGGSVSVTQNGSFVDMYSYCITADDMQNVVEDERMQADVVEPAEYNSDDGAMMRMIDTEAE